MLARILFLVCVSARDALPSIPRLFSKSHGCSFSQFVMDAQSEGSCDKKGCVGEVKNVSRSLLDHSAVYIRPRTFS